ncbi:MAG: non-canonical purine NTP pyrophosphatase, RdgB/HAM1 family [Flavobacterium sp. BFFFF2]|nr:MAG: non-canonical purine NTP pyrophosphatase, RdgB/HAM1 family [Flavobacterium sp. BFFFF2]
MHQTLYFASQNLNKFNEIAALLPEGFVLKNLDEFKLDHELAETGTTLEENAIQKATYIAERFGVACFADDSGLEVAALQGAPGIYSGRYAGEAKNHDANMNKLLHELQDKTDRSACFKTVIAYHDGQQVHCFTGQICGQIQLERKGNKGFGYDPLFIPDGHTLTFAEMSPEQKNQWSHRAKALKAFLGFLGK